ncbi:MAG: hypothetical protein R6X19_10905 [Kiritimatiellia bacterium]
MGRWEGLAALLIVLLSSLTASGEEVPFARLELEPASVYAGQPFSIVLAVFTTGQDLDSGLSISGIPEGIQLQPFQEMPAVQKKENGRTYQVMHYRCDAICPKPGSYELAPVIRGVTTRTTQSLFFIQQHRTPFAVGVQPVRLTVKPIPLEQAPREYTGLLGAFELETDLSTNRVVPGDLVTLTYTLSGRGRFDMISQIGYDAIPGFKVYPPRPEPTRSAPRLRTFTQVIVPLKPDSLTIPPLTLAAFNPASETFDLLTSGPYTLEQDTARPVAAPSAIVMNLQAPEKAPTPLPPIHAVLRTPIADAALRKSAAQYLAFGNDAYSQNRLSEAIDAYVKILVLGLRLPEVNANLGAACGRAGQNGKAVLFLLRALRNNPRDRLAREHLAQLVHRTAIPFPPALPVWSHLALREWCALILLDLVLVVFFLIRTRRFPVSRLAWLAVWGILAFSSTGTAWWLAGPPVRERVVTEPVAQGHLAPSGHSAPTVRLTGGIVVETLEISGDWERVQTGNVTTWIPSSALEKP